MIPAQIVRFIEERANVGFAGTRDANLVPRGHRVSGWHVADNGRRLTVLVTDPSPPQLIEALRDNGRIAVTLEEVATLETYQFKGRYLGHRTVRPDERALADRTRDRFVKGLRSLHPEGGVAERLGLAIPQPTLAVEMEVHEVFLQTPGPGAGSRVAPAPDAQEHRA